MHPFPRHVPIMDAAQMAHALARIDAQLSRAFTGTYGPSLPVAERAEYQGQKYWRHAFGDVSDMGMATEGNTASQDPSPSACDARPRARSETSGGGHG